MRLENSRLAQLASQIVERLNAQEVLAYGGWPQDFIGHFRPSLKLTIQSYRPQVEGARSIAIPSDVVVSIDHLSRVGVLKVHDVMDDLKRVTVKAGFFYVTIPEFADDVVTDGTVPRSSNWWLGEFMKRFEVHTFQRLPGGFYVIVYPIVDEVMH